MQNPELFQLIRREIEQNGPIPFARFMELALYQPEHGYYASGRASIGRHGDFFTNVSVGPLFGKLLAAQFAEIWERLGRPDDFTIVEQGAHDGRFAADVLKALRQSVGECFAASSYIIVEPFVIWRERQEKNLRDFIGKISWRKSIDQLARFAGVHFSNELFDSLPVHVIVSGGIANGATDWKEKFVTLSEHRPSACQRTGSPWRACAPSPESFRGCSDPPFKFVTAELSRPELRLDQPGFFPAGFETELSVAAPKLMGEIASKLSRGVILTIDYGFVRPEFYSLDRTEGSLQVRAKQKKLSSSFEQIGLADISAHVEWTGLAEAALSSGAKPIGFTDQHHFLTGIVSTFFPHAELNFSEKRALQTLLHPEMLGRNFQALALGKNFVEKLSGFLFARDPARELGI
jgi:SAM-dependent MidA family methyltransferase